MVSTNRRRLKSALAVFAIQLLVIALVLLIWQLSSGHWLPAFVVSKPSDVARDVVKFLGSTAGWHDIAVTYEEIVLGYLIGLGAGVLTGVALGLNRFAARILEPIVVAVNGVPHIVFAPIFIVLVGLSIWSKVAIAALGVSFIMFFSAYTGVRAVRRDLLDTVKLFGASRRELLRYVIIPNMMPSLVSGLRAGFSFALVGAIVGEYISSQAGVGYFIFSSQNLFNSGNTFAGVVVVMIMVLIGNRLFAEIQRHLLRWTEVHR